MGDSLWAVVGMHKGRLHWAVPMGGSQTSAGRQGQAGTSACGGQGRSSKQRCGRTSQASRVTTNGEPTSNPPLPGSTPTYDEGLQGVGTDLSASAPETPATARLQACDAVSGTVRSVMTAPGDSAQRRAQGAHFWLSGGSAAVWPWNDAPWCCGWRGCLWPRPPLCSCAAGSSQCVTQAAPLPHGRHTSWRRRRHRGAEWAALLIRQGGGEGSPGGGRWGVRLCTQPQRKGRSTQAHTGG